MIDGIKLRITDEDSINQLLNNPLLDWHKNENILSKKVISRIAKYKGFTFSVYKWGPIEIVGSIHKYFNGGKHNADDFTRSDLQSAINRLESEFGINPHTASLHNLEFGVNIMTPFNPNDLLESLLCFAWNRFNDMETDDHGMGKQCSPSTQWIIKIYNKGLQYKSPGNILRIEKRIVAMVALKWGNLYLSDLTNPELWDYCHRELLTMFDTILINEYVNVRRLTKKEQSAYLRAVNQNGWSKLGRDKKKRLKKDFNDIISRLGEQQYKPLILKLIDQKCIQLFNG